MKLGESASYGFVKKYPKWVTWCFLAQNQHNSVHYFFLKLYHMTGMKNLTKMTVLYIEEKFMLCPK